MIDTEEKCKAEEKAKVKTFQDEVNKGGIVVEGGRGQFTSYLPTSYISYILLRTMIF